MSFSKKGILCLTITWTSDKWYWINSGVETRVAIRSRILFCMSGFACIICVLADTEVKQSIQISNNIYLHATLKCNEYSFTCFDVNICDQDSARNQWSIYGASHQSNFETSIGWSGGFVGDNALHHCEDLQLLICMEIVTHNSWRTNRS